MRGCPTLVAVATAGARADPAAFGLEVLLASPFFCYVIPGYHPRFDLAAKGSGLSPPAWLAATR